MTDKPINSFPNLAELHTWLEASESQEDSANLVTSLRLGGQELTLPDGQVFRIQTHRAFLCLFPTGMEIDPNQKYGERIKLGVSQKENSTVNKGTEIGASGGLGIGNLLDPTTGKLSIEFSASAKRSASATVESSIESEVKFVKPIGNDTWQVEEIVPDTPLDGSYLYNTSLCRVRPTKGANRSSLVAIVHVKQRDLSISLIEGTEGWKRLLNSTSMNKNKERVIGILIAKSLNEQLSEIVGNDFRGVVTLSVHEVESEDEAV